MDFFARLKAIARQRGLTLKAVLEEADISRYTYNTWQRCHRLPRVDQAVELAKALGVSVEELMFDSSSPRSESVQGGRSYQVSRKEIIELCKMMETMDSKELSLIKTMIQTVHKMKKS